MASPSKRSKVQVSANSSEALLLAREATILVRAGAAPVDGVLALHHLGVVLAHVGREEESRALLAEAGD